MNLDSSPLARTGIKYSGVKTMFQPSPKTTHPVDLGAPFEKIIRSWGAEKIQLLELDLSKKTYLPMERMVLLSGSLVGTLVLRSSRNFTIWIQKQREETSPEQYSEPEIFDELVSLYGLYLFHEFWKPDSFQIGPINPFLSVPMDWPEKTPENSCALLVEGHRVEMRLWLKN